MRRPDERRPADDPRWKLAQAESRGPYPELDSHQTFQLRIAYVLRQHEIEIIYWIGMPEASPPSFMPNQWRATIPHGSTLPGIKAVPWDPDRFSDFWNRIVYYQLQTHYGAVRDPRSVVQALAQSRYEWEAERTAEHAAWLRDRHLNRVPVGARRYLVQLKESIMEAGGPCTYCGDPDPRTVDHIVPSSRGGPDRPRNLTIACGPCNFQKNNRTPEEWKAYRLARGLPWPPLPKSAAPSETEIPA